MDKQKGFAKVKVRLGGCKVERWLVLPDSMTLEDFHDAIQAAWEKAIAEGRSKIRPISDDGWWELVWAQWGGIVIGPWGEGCRRRVVVPDRVREWDSWLAVPACGRVILDRAEQTGTCSASKGRVFDQSKGRKRLRAFRFCSPQKFRF